MSTTPHNSTTRVLYVRSCLSLTSTQLNCSWIIWYAIHDNTKIIYSLWDTFDIIITTYRCCFVFSIISDVFWLYYVHAMHGMGIRSNRKKFANSLNPCNADGHWWGNHQSMPLFQGNLTAPLMHAIRYQHSRHLTLPQYRVCGILPRTTKMYGRPT